MMRNNTRQACRIYFSPLLGNPLYRKRFEPRSISSSSTAIVQVIVGPERNCFPHQRQVSPLDSEGDFRRNVSQRQLSLELPSTASLLCGEENSPIHIILNKFHFPTSLGLENFQEIYG